MTGRSDGLRVFFVAAEVAPFAKSGGLADVAGSLPKALARLGDEVRVCMPHYGAIRVEGLELEPSVEFGIEIEGRTETATVSQCRYGEVLIYFIGNPGYFGREHMYGYPDDDERFIFFSMAAIKLLEEVQWRPDVVHCNDWHTGLIPNYLKTLYQDHPHFAETAAVLTIHNLAYQGVYGWETLRKAGLDSYGFVYPQIADLAHNIDFLGRGILWSDMVNTVSERYALEIQTPEYGEKLDPLLRDRRDRLTGILNGIDFEEFNPATDTHIPVNYDVSTLDRRVENKLALQKECGLPVDPSKPLIGLVSRLADQKGFDLLANAVHDIMRLLDIQMVILGTGDEHFERLFRGTAGDYPSRFAAFLTFDAGLAQRIYAGVDIFMMPSRFEPCGLGQLISFRYGAVPMVRATGGLADTVENYNPATGEGNGFSFEAYNHMMLFATLVRGIEAYRNRRLWRTLQERGMSADFSWMNSARKYREFYRRAMEFRRVRERASARPVATGGGA